MDSKKLTLTVALLFCALPSAVGAQEAVQEIDYLLHAIGSSDCAFVRNGTRHTATDAQAHLRMKYKRGKRYASTAEYFVERLASRSSMSKKPYFIDCENTEIVTAREWLLQRLAEYRAGLTNLNQAGS